MTDQAEGLEARVAELGGTLSRDLPIINGFVAEMNGRAILELAQDATVQRISRDDVVTGAALPQAVTVIDNLALNKPVTQSSTNYGGVPERAVDG